MYLTGDSDEEVQQAHRIVKSWLLSHVSSYASFWFRPVDFIPAGALFLTGEHLRPTLPSVARIEELFAMEYDNRDLNLRLGTMLKDNARAGRYLKILAFEDTHVLCRDVANKDAEVTQIKLSRIHRDLASRRTGFTIVRQADATRGAA